MTTELNVYTELKQNMTKLHLTDMMKLPNIREGFYEDMTKYVKDTVDREANVLFSKFKRARIVKMVKNASVGISADTLNLSPEEVILYNEIVNSIDKFWSTY